MALVGTLAHVARQGREAAWIFIDWAGVLNTCHTLTLSAKASRRISRRLLRDPVSPPGEPVVQLSWPQSILSPHAECVSRATQGDGWRPSIGRRTCRSPRRASR